MTSDTSPRIPSNRAASSRELLRTYLKSQAIQRAAVLVLAFLACTYTLYFARGFLLPIFVALFVSIVLRPIVDALARFGLPRPLAAAIVLLALLAICGLGVRQLLDPIGEWTDRLPHLAAELRREFASLRASIEEAKEVTKQVSEIAAEDDGQEKVVIEGPGLAEQVFARAQDAFVSIAASLVLLFFMLSQGREKLQRLIAALPERSQRYQWRQALGQAKKDVALYLRTITLVNCVLGAVTGLAMALIGLPNPVLWGVLTCLANFLPYIGPLVVCAFIAAASLLTFDSWFLIVLPPLTFLVLTAVEGHIMTPLLLGRRLTINPIAVFLAVLFWSWIWGIPGALLAVPLLTIFKIVVDQVESLRVFKILLK